MSELESIWRYMDSDKFMNLISTSSLFFASPIDFDDPWECCFPKSWGEHKHWKAFFDLYGDKMSEKNLDLLPKGMINALHAMYADRKRLGVSCWYKNEKESESMWRLYCKNKNAVSIKSSIERLLYSLGGQNRVYVGEVKYVDFMAPYKMEDYVIHTYRYDQTMQCVEKKDIKDELLPFLLKRLDFEVESEVRAVLLNWPWMERASNLKVDLEVLIEEVVISPFADEWYVDSIAKFVDTLPISLKGKIRKSSLYTPPELMDYDAINNSLDFLVKVQKEDTLIIEFNGMAEFEKWHSEVMDKLNLPLVPVCSNTGGVVLDGGITTAWTTPMRNPNNERVAAYATRSLISQDHKVITRSEAERLGYINRADDL